MKKLLIILIVITSTIFGCKDKDKNTETVLVIPIGDTTRIIDTTIIEDGEPPLVVDNLAKVKPEKQKKEKISCGFGLKKFNNRKRPIAEAPGGKKGKPVKPGTEPPPPPPPVGTFANTVYLNFWGKEISNTMWNVNGTFTVNDAGMAQSEIDHVVTTVTAHYRLYNINVTVDRAIFDSAPIGHKVEVIITESWEWYGQAGGVAYLNSFNWTDGTPAFVFSTLLNYNSHNIAEAAAHETGHTIGLRHQSLCEGNTIVSQYNWGDGVRAPVMGSSYNVVMGEWFPDGPTPLGCLVRQNDPAILQSKLGLKQ